MSDSILWLTESDVVSLVTLNDGIKALEKVLIAESNDNATNIAKALGTWGDGSSAHSLGSMSEALGYVGFKTWVNTKKGAQGLYLLFDAELGRVLAVIEVAAMGSIRTAAISGVATKYLAPENANELAIIGTGRQALMQVAAVAVARKLDRVRIFSPRADSRLAFKQLLDEHFDFNTQVCTSIEEATNDAPIITLVTRATQPILTAQMLAPSCHINAVGAILPANAEIDASVLDSCDGIFVDNLENTQRTSREFNDYFNADEKKWAEVHILGSYINGKAHERLDGVTLFKSMGMGLSDLAVAIEAYNRALKTRTGKPIEAPVKCLPKWTIQ